MDMEAGSGDFDTPDTQSNKNGLKRTVQQDDENVAIFKIFANHVIFEKLMEYVDHSSLKALTETSHVVKSIIRESRTFVDRSTIRILRPYGVPGLNPKTLHSSDFPWRNVALEINGWTEEELEILLSLISPAVESLEVYVNRMVEGDLTAKAETVINLLLRAQNIKQLTIGPHVLGAKGFKDILAQNSTLQKNLKKLESFCITENETCNCFLTAEIVDQLVANLDALFEIPFKLKSFKLKLDSLGSFQAWAYNNIQEAILAILTKHAPTLTTLRLDGEIWREEPLSRIACPSLDHLSIRAKGVYLANIVSFITNQPPLETISLTLKESTFSGLPFLNTLRSHGNNLKKLCVSWKLDPIVQVMNLQGHVAPGNYNDGNVFGANGQLAPPPADPLTGPLDYSFLQHLQSLEEFKIRQVNRSQDNGVAPVVVLDDVDPRSILGAFLTSLSSELKKIDIAGAISGAWAGDPPESTIDNLRKFRNLTSLKVMQCPNAINDRIIRFICCSLRQLKELGFSHCYELTDLGIIGRHQGTQVQVPGISSLTRLKTLCIYSCPRLTPEGLFTAISFPDLKSLTLIIETEMTREFYMDLVKKNKSLEALTIHEDMQEAAANADGNYSMFPNLESQLKALSHRFRTVKYSFPLSWNLSEASETNDDESVSGGGYPDASFDLADSRDCDSFDNDDFSDDDE